MNMNFLIIYLISIATIFFGYILGEVINETKLIEIIGVKTSKIAKFGLHPSLTPVPALYLVSPRVAHANASTLLKEELIEPTDLYITILASKLPARIMHIYRYYLPVLLPLLGIITLYYICLGIIFDIFIVFIALSLGRRRYNNMEKDSKDVKVKPDFSRKTLKNGIKKGAKTSLKFILRFTPLFFLVVLMLNLGILDKITTALSPFLGSLGLDSLGITYITTSIFSPRASYGVAKVMLSYYPIQKMLGCMFLGTGLYVALNECWTKSLPFYSALYPKKVSLKLLFLQSGLTSIYNISLGCILLILA